MRTATRLTLVVFLPFLLAGGLTTALGFELIQPGRKWFQGIGGGPSDLPVTLLINQNGEDSVADADHGVTAMRDAAAWWENELENGLLLLSTGTTPVNAVGQDGLNVVSFDDPSRVVRNALAVTIVGWYDNNQTETVNGIDFGRYEETDVSFSKRYDFTTAALGGCSGQFDLEAVGGHEVGHALGLGHSSQGGALMYASVASCDFKRITTDDHDGINTIYNPGFGGGGSPPGCVPTQAFLTGHSCSSPTRGPNCLVIDIAVTDDCGDGVGGADVTVQLVGVEAGDVLSGTASTNGNGSVSFGLRCKDAASTTYASTVQYIVGSLPWNPLDPGNTAPNPLNCVITR